MSAVLFAERADMATNTLKAYRSAWRRWQDWTVLNKHAALPAEPEAVAAWLNERHTEGIRPATLAVAIAAIGYAHSEAGLLNPCSSPTVMRTLRGIRRTAGATQRQARGLTASDVDAIAQTACTPRVHPSGRTETRFMATRRGLVDIAIVRVMRDGLLRSGEAAALCWGDITGVGDGSGRMLIRRSKTDPDGEGAVMFLSTASMAALRVIRSPVGDQPTASVFRMNRGDQIARRIREACEHAGLGDGYSGHSPRVGMAQDLAAAGVELPALMTAGRWRSPTMPAHYIRNQTADRGAVAQYHGYRRQGLREW